MANSWHDRPDAYLKRALASYKADVEDIEAELARRREAAAPQCTCGTRKFLGHKNGCPIIGWETRLEKPPQCAVDDAVEKARTALQKHMYSRGVSKGAELTAALIDAKIAAALRTHCLLRHGDPQHWHEKDDGK